MKRLVLFTVLALVIPAAAYADTITTGDLSFTCENICFIPASIDLQNFAHTAPTSGSFTYDNTTNQFLNFTIIWDGITFGVDGLTETNYLALLSIGPNLQEWSGYCQSGGVVLGPQFSCDDRISFDLFLLNGNGNPVPDKSQVSFLSIDNTATIYPFDSSNGTITATDLVTTTPEPESWILMLMVMVMVIGSSILGSRVVERRLNFDASAKHQRSHAQDS